MIRALIISGLVLISVSLLQSQQADRTEIVDKRTYSSKTYQNSDGSYSLEMNLGYVHYKNDEGEFEEINRNIIASSAPEYDYEVTRGMYHVYFKSDINNSQSIAFETKGGVGAVFQPFAVAYLDISSKEYQILQRVQSSNAVVNGNEIVYQNVFSNVHFKFSYLDTKLKEEILLTQQARNSLPSPSQYGFNPSSTYLVFITKLDFDIPTTSPFVNGQNIRQVVYEGEDQINFKNLKGKIKFFLPVDMAFLASDRDSLNVEHFTKIKKRIITQNGQRFLLSGVSLNWVNSLPVGTIIFDPQIEIESPIQDTWIENNSSSHFGSYSQIRIGRGANYGWKRSLVKFNLDEIDIPTNYNIISAQCKFYWYGCWKLSGGIYVDRPIKLHQILTDWNEAQADWYERLNSVPWNTSGVGFNNIDARSGEEDIQVWDVNNYPKWMIYDVTGMVKRWIEEANPNYGMILWATNESTYDNADEKWAYSSNYSNSDYHPKLIINYSLPQSITYYIRDAAGNVIATYKKNTE